MSEHRNSLQPGYKLHWYVIKNILGQGGFGITYLAEDTNLNQLVAIKEFLPIEMAVRETDASIHPVSGEYGEQFKWGLDRFISEAQTLAKFKHPNIVRVFTVFNQNNTAYMVMEYEHGEGLDEILKQRKKLPEAELKGIILPIMDGLEQVHASGFIHRDIKPANIYIRKDGGPVLLDFGSARQSFGQHTRTLTAMVSPGYAPFEQYVSKSDKQGPWTDIYGLGATSYRAVTGKSPAAAVDRSEALLHAQRDSYVPAVEMCSDEYSRGFLQAIDHALAFKANDRPENIMTWRQEIDQSISTQAEEIETQVHPGIVAITDGKKDEQQTVKITMKASTSAPSQEENASRQSNKFGRRYTSIAVVVLGVVVLLLLTNKGQQQDQGDTIILTPSSPIVPSVDLPVTQPEPEPEPEPETVKTPQLEEIIQDSSNANETDKLSKDYPKLISARDKHRLVSLKRKLHEDPQDKKTANKLREITDKFAKKIRQAMRSGELDVAESYVHEVLELAPENKKLKKALQRIQERKASKQRD